MEYKLKEGLEVIIMGRERPSETLRAIEAIQQIDFGVETHVIVSDNASSLEKALSGLPIGIEHRLRNPGGSWNWHFNKIVSELQYEWCLITHDDDELLPILGNVFNDHRNDPRVLTITGLSQIVDHQKGFVVNANYESRIDAAGIRDKAGTVYFNLSEKLFDLGTLFPASAMITRSSLLRNLAPLDPRFEWTADFGLSILVSHNKGVVFEGRQAVMNYHLHKNNSVFTDEAAGGLKSDFTVTRILMLEKFPELYNRARASKLLRDVFISKILISAFNLKARQSLLKATIRSSKTLRISKFNFLAMKIPIYLGPLASCVRFFMRKRIGA